MKKQSIFTSDVSQSLLEHHLSGNFRKILVFSGKRSYTTSGAAKVIKGIAQLGKYEISRVSDFNTNPRLSDLESSLKKIREYCPDVIIAIGGGSVIDMAKLTRFFESHSGEIFNGQYTKIKDNIPLIAIPTTSGTGSETTHFAVLYDGNIKHSIAHPEILPDNVILDPTLTYNTDSYLTACSGFDALAQAIEAYWNKNATSESDGYARRAIELLWTNLPIAVHSPNERARKNMMEGAYWAGKAINITKTTAPHAFSYPFTMHYGYPHGHAVALTFPMIAELNLVSDAIPDNKRAYLLSVIAPSGNLADAIRQYISSIGLGFRGEEIDTSKILSGINLSRLSNNPVAITEEMTHKILGNL